MFNLFTTRPRVYFAGIAIFILYKGLYFCIIWSIPCHYSDWEDALPSAEDPNFSPSSDSIFFHETSCRGGLTVRQACSVEAAARAHPQWQVYVLFSSPVTSHTLKSSCLANLLQFHNIKFLRVHVAEYSRGTIVQSTLLNDMKQSKYPIEHSADVLRILTLNKWGGIYLDTDMIVTRSLEDLPANFVAKESPSDLASGILSFAKDKVGTNATNEILKIIRKTYRPQYWSVGGAVAVDAALKLLCPEVVSSSAYISDSIINCAGVTIYDFELFYPQYFNELDVIFNRTTDMFDLERPYTYHMWNFLSHRMKINKNTVYEVVAKTYCPTIHHTYHSEFGVVADDQTTVKTTTEDTQQTTTTVKTR